MYSYTTILMGDKALIYFGQIFKVPITLQSGAFTIQTHN